MQAGWTQVQVQVQAKQGAEVGEATICQSGKEQDLKGAGPGHALFPAIHVGLELIRATGTRGGGRGGAGV